MRHGCPPGAERPEQPRLAWPGRTPPCQTRAQDLAPSAAPSLGVGLLAPDPRPRGEMLVVILMHLCRGWTSFPPLRLWQHGLRTSLAADSRRPARVTSRRDLSYRKGSLAALSEPPPEAAGLTGGERLLTLQRPGSVLMGAPVACRLCFELVAHNARPRHPGARGNALLTLMAGDRGVWPV